MSSFLRPFLYISVFVLILMPISAFAQDIKIAVVDVEKVLNESKAGMAIQKQLSEKREAFQKEFSGRENNLMNIEKQLIEKKKDSTSEAFAEERKKFDKQLLETRNLFQKRRNDLDKGLGHALGELRKNIIQVAAEIADDEKYQVVLTRDSVVIIQKEMDITNKVLDRLNKKIPNIKLDVAE